MKTFDRRFGLSYTFRWEIDASIRESGRSKQLTSPCMQYINVRLDESRRLKQGRQRKSIGSFAFPDFPLLEVLSRHE